MAVSLRGTWKKSSLQHTNDGEKVIFRCAGGKYRTAECPAKLYLLYHADSAKVALYQTEADHANHDGNPSRGLPPDMKVVIKQLFSESIRKPNAILHALRTRNLGEPAKAKVVHWLRKIRNADCIEH